MAVIPKLKIDRRRNNTSAIKFTSDRSGSPVNFRVSVVNLAGVLLQKTILSRSLYMCAVDESRMVYRENRVQKTWSIGVRLFEGSGSTVPNIRDDEVKKYITMYICSTQYPL